MGLKPRHDHADRALQPCHPLRNVERAFGVSIPTIRAIARDTARRNGVDAHARASQVQALGPRD